MPLHLVVSGYGPPDMPRLAPPMSELPDQQLLSSLGDFYGGVPAELTADPELAALVVPAYRADLRALENYRYSERPPVPCPLTVIGGDQDVYSAEQLARWRRHAGAAYRLTVLPGGHFYFRDRPEPLWRELRSVLATPADGPGPTAAAAADAH
jgi:surfactin synthase thioesterase subunit